MLAAAARDLRDRGARAHPLNSQVNNMVDATPDEKPDDVQKKEQSDAVDEAIKKLPDIPEKKVLLEEAKAAADKAVKEEEAAAKLQNAEEGKAGRAGKTE